MVSKKFFERLAKASEEFDAEEGGNPSAALNVPDVVFLTTEIAQANGLRVFTAGEDDEQPILITKVGHA